MCALLLATELKVPIPHLQSNRFYACMLNGEEYLQKPKKSKRAEFDFDDSEHDGQPTKSRRCSIGGQPMRPRKPRAKRAAAAALAVNEDGDSATQSGSGSEANSKASSGTPRSSSSSTSTSSSSEKPKLDVEVDEEKPKPVEKPVEVDEEKPRPEPIAKKRAEREPVPAGERMGRISNTTFFWHGFKFCQIRAGLFKEVVTGYEAKCYAGEHNQCKPACCRRMQFSQHGGEDMTLRKLKWWCVMPLQTSEGGSTCRLDHKDHKPWLKAPVVPGTDELDRLGAMFDE